MECTEVLNQFQTTIQKSQSRPNCEWNSSQTVTQSVCLKQIAVTKLSKVVT